MFRVTGGAGFISYNIIKSINDLSIMLVDDLTNGTITYTDWLNKQ